MQIIIITNGVLGKKVFNKKLLDKEDGINLR